MMPMQLVRSAMARSLVSIGGRRQSRPGAGTRRGETRQWRAYDVGAVVDGVEVLGLDPESGPFIPIPGPRP
jgi:hypothetical protein